MTLLNIDECVGYSGPDKCEQNCTNTDGSFNCNCFDGYELNRNGHSCDDIDECSRGTKLCKKTEICVNTLGNSSCLCAPGYQRDESNDCKKIDGGSYAGSIEFEMIQVGEKVENDSIKDTGSLVQKKLTYGFNGSSFLNVDVVGLTVIQNHTKYRLQATFIVHVKLKTFNGTVIKNILSKSFRENYKNGNKTDLGQGISFNMQPINFKVLSKGLCTIPERVECDVRSTDCEDTGGETRCHCKTGFKTVPNSNKFCEVSVLH
ncbi:fibrillin-2-like [Ruditapes philippinarum]|uniref:fibrillin-2-like n=1 Tax=Ruditapes philippinarum TaxID=129788 RepID=UPI00295B7EB8|nr:fibrillin-2-like [Ruditapes philippinarum]